MSKFTTRDEFLADVDKERAALDKLLAEIPTEHKGVEVVDDMTVKDFLAHRTEWGAMMLGWLAEARDGGTPAVPSPQYKWNQLKELNADIKARYADVPLATIERDFAQVHDQLRDVIAAATDEELFTKKHYTFTGSSDLVTYLNSATAAHYRSARRHIKKWWKAEAATLTEG